MQGSKGAAGASALVGWPLLFAETQAALTLLMFFEVWERQAFFYILRTYHSAFIALQLYYYQRKSPF